GRLFVSRDNGKHWELVFEKQNFDFAELIFNNDKIIYAACVNSGILCSKDGGYNFKPLINGLPEGVPYNTIAIDPNSSGKLYTAPKRKSYNTNVPLVPLYTSDDGGANWLPLSNYSLNDFSKYPGYILNEEYIGWSIARIMVDAENPNRLFMCNWYGVSVSEDRGKTWCGNYFAGTETVCCENLITDPLIKGKAYFTLPDHRPFVTVDGGKTFVQYRDDSPYHNSTVIVSSVNKSGLLLIGAKKDWSGYAGSAIIRSEDDGKTFEVVKEFVDGLTVQSIKEDLNKPGRFFAFLDRKISDGAGIYYSNDYGLSWERMEMNLPHRVTQFPQRQMLIENEILSIVWGQQKNVCGTNQLLCVDPFKQNTIYLGEWTEGVFCTSDNGKNWQDLTAGLPFFKDSTALLVSLAVDKHVSGVLYAGFLKNGLWKSANKGKTWRKIYPSDGKLFNASSIVVGEYAENELIVSSEPLYWAPSESQIIYSNDGGKDWKDLYFNEYGALRWKSIAEDAFSGTLYGATAGNGVFYFNRR
ncbi:MAG: hypothetical protein JXB49_18245, partial [Bacteroidales bacterium]|nr:hypothetical protein [Bacteroidales bacterium]